MLLQGLQQDVTTFLITWGPFILLLVAAAVLGYLFEKFVIAAIKRATKSTATEIDDIIVRAVHPALVFAIFVGAVWIGIRYLGTGLPPDVVVWTRNISLAIVVILAALVGSRLVHGLLQFRARKRPEWRSAANLGGRILSTIIYVLAFLTILDFYGVSITPILTSLGIAGIAVALALQDTLSNFFAGIWMQTGRAMRPGHFVRVEDSRVEGYVVEVGWRTTKIRTLPNNIVIIPNAKLSQSVVTDYHLPETRMALLISVSVGYEADPAHVEKVLVEETLAAAETTPGLLREPAPFVRFIPGFGDYSLQFTLICQVREFVDQYLAQHEIRKRILARFAKEGIRIPYPIREQHVVPSQRADVAVHVPEAGSGAPPGS